MRWWTGLVLLTALVTRASCIVEQLENAEQGNDKNELRSYLNAAKPFLASFCNFGATEGEPYEECQRCTESLKLFLDHLAEQRTWAVLMADAFVKPPTGILSGTFSFVSNYDQCLKIPEFDLDDMENPLQKYPRLPAKVKGAYCSFKLRLKRNKFFKRPENQTLSEFQETMKKEEHKMDDVYKLQEEFPGFVGLCVPSPCSKMSFENLGLAVKNILLKYIKPNRENFPFLVGMDAVSCHQADDLPPPSFGARFITGIFVLMAVIVLTGTVVDVIFCLRMKRFDDSKSESVKHTYEYAMKSNSMQMLRSCSAVVSFRQLMDTRLPTNSVKCLYGVKFFAIVWLIMGTTGQLRAANMTTNMKEMEQTLQTMTSQFVLNKDLAADSLLVVSGILFAYGLSRRNGVGHVLRYCGHRLMKTVPVYYLLLWFLVCCFARMGAGPTWDIESKRYLSNCGKTWWANIAFINNFLKFESQCMPHSWLVAYLMQGLVLGVIATFFWKKAENLTHFALGVLVVATMVVDFALNLTNNLGPTTLLREYRAGSKNDYMSVVGMHLYSRGGPLLIGLIIGFIFNQRMNSKRTFSKLGRIAITFMWLMIMVAVVVCVNASFNWNRGASYPSNSASAVYDAFHRVVFALATGLLIMMCYAGKGGIVNMVLTWPGFVPLGKLWLLIYLVHPFVIFHSNGTLRATVYYTKKQLFSEVLWNLIMSIVVSAVLHILLVAPFQAIERFFYDTFVDPSDDSDSGSTYQRYTYPKKVDPESGSSVQSSPSADKNREDLPEPYDKHKRDFSEDTTDVGGRPDEQEREPLVADVRNSLRDHSHVGDFYEAPRIDANIDELEESPQRGRKHLELQQQLQQLEQEIEVVENLRQLQDTQQQDQQEEDRKTNLIR